MLNGKCALVTGSVGGLGHAIAAALAKAGARTILHGLADIDTGQVAADELAEQFAVETGFSNADLSSPDEIGRLMTWASDRFGGVDIVVNNAVVRHFSPIDAFSAEDWNHSVAVNLSGAFHLMRLALPHMRRRNWGRIVNISSIYGLRGAENRIDYVTTKTALIGMTRAAAVELAKTGITCNAICPGTVPSPAILERIDRNAEAQGISSSEAAQRYLATRNPSGRFVAAEGVGELVSFLCGPHGADITGATLPIDGGWSAG